MPRFALLSSPRLYLVDCEVDLKQVKAGWVYLDGDLAAVEVIKDQAGMVELPIVITPKTQAIRQPSEFYFADDTVDFERDFDA